MTTEWLIGLDVALVGLLIAGQIASAMLVPILDLWDWLSQPKVKGPTEEDFPDFEIR